MVDHHLDRGGGVEDELACGKPVADRAERVDVGAPVDVRFPQRDLGRHVGRGARGHALLGELGLGICRGLDILHQPEVEHLHEVVVDAQAGGEDVGGLDVAVDQPVLVRVGERVAGLGQQIHGALDRHRAVLLHQRVEVEPLEVLHDVIEGSVLCSSEVVELDRVG